MLRDIDGVEDLRGCAGIIDMDGTGLDLDVAFQRDLAVIAVECDLGAVFAGRPARDRLAHVGFRPAVDGGAQTLAIGATVFLPETTHSTDLLAIYCVPH